MRSTLVFCGPTISHDQARSKLDCICLPPAVQGSIISAVVEFDPGIIILLDGGFQSEPAIKHKEILWAISRGVAVVGASSMGALRAAELAPHMIGIGLIYRWYKRFALVADDAVAVQHGPADVNFAPLTDSLIDLRLTFRSAFRQGKISCEVARSLETTARELNFRERTLGRCIAAALPGVDANLVRSALEGAVVRQKHRDAVAALEWVKKRGNVTPAKSFQFVLTQAFVTDLTDSGFEPHILRAYP